MIDKAELERLAERWQHKADQWECGATRAQIVEFVGDLRTLAARCDMHTNPENLHTSGETCIDQVPLPEPFAWYILVREKDDGYYVDDLDDAQAIDDMTNHAAEETPMFSDDQLHAHREEYAAARVAAETAALRAELDALRLKTRCAMGVGDGSGRLFVYGDYDSIKAAQRTVLRAEALQRERDEARAEAERLRKDAERYRLLRSAPRHAFVTRCVGGALIPRYEGDALDRLTDAILADRRGEP